MNNKFINDNIEMILCIIFIIGIIIIFFLSNNTNNNNSEFFIDDYYGVYANNWNNGHLIDSINSHTKNKKCFYSLHCDLTDDSTFACINSCDVPRIMSSRNNDDKYTYRMYNSY